MDDRDNLLVANNDNAALQLPLGGGSQITLPFSGLDGVQFPAVDAAGNVFTTTYDANELVELPGWQPAPDGSEPLTNPMGVAVNSAGDLLVFTSDPSGSGYVGELQRCTILFIEIRDGDYRVYPQPCR